MHEPHNAEDHLPGLGESPASVLELHGVVSEKSSQSMVESAALRESLQMWNLARNTNLCRGKHDRLD
jgi:hypothetical protein